ALQWQGRGAGNANPSSFQVPLLTNVVFLPTSSYKQQNPPVLIPLVPNNPLNYSMNVQGSYPQPHWVLNMTNRIRCMIVDRGTNGAANRVVDYVQLNGLNAVRDLTQEALANDQDGVWATTTGPYIGATPMPVGIINQIQIASGGTTSPSFSDQTAITF